MKTIQAVRGMNDLLPTEIATWQNIERHCAQVFACYGYQEIRLPMVEKTELFKRGIGEATDIVEKEMYTFLDRNGDSLTLRPEGTASCVRAVIEHQLLRYQRQKLWYAGPMFRYERPQKGRYRQFYQMGVEALGWQGFAIEAEMILMTARLWQVLGISDAVTLRLNSLGTPEARQIYREHFVSYCREHFDQLDEDSKRRLETNPFRILDSKNPTMQSLLMAAPQLQNYLDAQSKHTFNQLVEILAKAGLNVVIDSRLVRGLDYYTGTVFEWLTDKLGAQGAICAGGRYDDLIYSLGGPSTPAIGFAMGMERMIALMPQLNATHTDADIFMVIASEAREQAEQRGILMVEQLRQALPALRFVTNFSGGSFKAQFKRADKSGARFALILGEDELNKNMLTCKNLRQISPQVTLPIAELIDYLRSQW